MQSSTNETFYYKNSKGKKFGKFLKTSILEISFIILLLVFIFGLLFYLNILHFPAVTSIINTTIQKSENIFTKTSPTPTPSAYTYNQSLAEQSVISFTDTYLSSKYLPNTLNVQHKLDTQGQLEDTDYTFGAYWETSQAIFRTIFHYENESDKTRDMEILISDFNAPPTNIDGVVSTLKEYFPSVAVTDTNLKCRQDAQSLRCEYFYTAPNGTKYGIGGWTNRSYKNEIYNAYQFCTIPSGSTMSNWKSCWEDLSTTGI